MPPAECAARAAMVALPDTESVLDRVIVPRLSPRDCCRLYPAGRKLSINLMDPAAFAWYAQTTPLLILSGHLLQLHPNPLKFTVCRMFFFCLQDIYHQLRMRFLPDTCQSTGRRSCTPAAGDAAAAAVLGVVEAAGPDETADCTQA